MNLPPPYTSYNDLIIKNTSLRVAFATRQSYETKSARDCFATARKDDKKCRVQFIAPLKIINNVECRLWFLPQQKGFTLAEVLITLVIIGIVATLTVPSIVNEYKKKATLTQLKKGYSIMSQIIRRSEIDNGPVATWDVPFINQENNDANNSEFFKKYLAPYINTVNKFSFYTNKQNHIVYNIDGTKGARYFKSVNRLSDGSSIAMAFYPQYNLTTANPGKKYKAITWIFYDVNNTKGPNRLGKDVFVFSIDGGKLHLWADTYGGYDLQTARDFPCKKGTNVTFAGMNCGAWIQQNNWEFPEGYPW